MSLARKLLASLLVCGLAAVTLAAATWSSFSATTANPSNSFSAGTVAISDNDVQPGSPRRERSGKFVASEIFDQNICREFAADRTHVANGHARRLGLQKSCGAFGFGGEFGGKGRDA